MHSSPVSPPPFMVGMAEIELDRETGTVEVLNFDAVVDCGIPINPALARIQVEGGIVQGIGHTLMEDVTRTPKGRYPRVEPVHLPFAHAPGCGADRRGVRAFL